MSRRAATILLATFVLASGLILVRSGGTYATQDRDAILSESTPQHSAGTDQLGRDRTIRCASALLLDLAAATVASAVTACIAAFIGVAAAFSPALIASALMLGSDLFLTLPWLFLLMIVRSGLSLTTSPMRSATITFAILALLGWPACARAVYRGTLLLRRSDWTMYGRATGLRPAQLVHRHILPHLKPLLLPQFLVCIPAFIIAEANLGTLGLGIAEPLPSWGSLLLDADNSALLARSHWLYLPAILLAAVLLLLEAIAASPRSGTLRARPRLQVNRSL